MNCQLQQLRIWNLYWTVGVQKKLKEIFLFSILNSSSSSRILEFISSNIQQIPNCLLCDNESIIFSQRNLFNHLRKLSEKVFVAFWCQFCLKQWIFVLVIVETTIVHFICSSLLGIGKVDFFPALKHERQEHPESSISFYCVGRSK